jgi:3-oxoacyl-[acyl-carrier-protein] synthase-3
VESSTDMTSARQVYLSEFSFELGALREISDLRGDIDASVVETFLGLGLRHYRFSDVPASVLAVRSLERTLVNQQENTPDLVLYCSTRIAEYSKEIADFVKAYATLGLATTPVVGVSMNGCANFGVAVEMAQAVVLTGQASCVAIVTADVCVDPAERVTMNNSAILSDSAASCLVSEVATEGGYAVRAISTATDLRINSTIDFIKAYRFASAGVRQVTRRVLDRAGVEICDLDRLITMNLQPNTLRFYLLETGFKGKTSGDQMLSRNAHAFGADIIMNLVETARALTQSHPERVHKPVFALSVSPSTWNAMVLQLL